MCSVGLDVIHRDGGAAGRQRVCSLRRGLRALRRFRDDQPLLRLCGQQPGGGQGAQHAITRPSHDLQPIKQQHGAVFTPKVEAKRADGGEQAARDGRLRLSQIAAEYFSPRRHGENKSSCR